MIPIDKTNRTLWSQLLANIKKTIDPHNFEIWFSPTQLYSITSEKIIIKVPNSFFKDWMEKKYYHLIQTNLSHLSGKKMEIEFLIPKSDGYQIRRDLSPPNKEFSGNYRIASRLNSRYNFNNFVIGNSNRLAHAAALAVAQSPARAYNPLFIYGDVGLGKTHLLQAIAHYILQNNSHLRFSYVSSEEFTNELINAIRDDKTANFRKKYRYSDILLVDDVHFLGGKERTQEEFFHTFNALYEAHKQIVLSSDRPPVEIPTLERRLRSRFEWGLITDIQAPDLETRIAILRKKASADNMELPPEIALFIAERIKTNIRKLEGCLVRLMAHSSLFNEKIDLTSVKEILRDILPKDDLEPVTIELIHKVISKYYKVKEIDIKGKKRVKSIVYPRQIAMYLTRELTDYSFPEIGQKFGGKDHTTVMYAWRKISQQREKNSNINKELIELENLVKKQRELE